MNAGGENQSCGPFSAILFSNYDFLNLDSALESVLLIAGANLKPNTAYNEAFLQVELSNSEEASLSFMLPIHVGLSDGNGLKFDKS